MSLSLFSYVKPCVHSLTQYTYLLQAVYFFILFLFLPLELASAFVDFILHLNYIMLGTDCRFGHGV